MYIHIKKVQYLPYRINLQEAVKQRNEEAMSCYTAALNETPPNVSASIILQNLKFTSQ